jgi:hypothetical protein
MNYMNRMAISNASKVVTRIRVTGEICDCIRLMPLRREDAENSETCQKCGRKLNTDFGNPKT